MTDLATPLLEVNKIEVVEGFNPRSHMDPDALARLAGSLRPTWCSRSPSDRSRAAGLP